MTPRVAIIGAGLAGLTAAHRLLAKNVEVTLIDAGRHGGGRLCTRAVNLPDGRTATFDLGPPILYVRRTTSRDAAVTPWHRATALDAELPGESLFRHRVVGRIGASGEPAGDAQPGGLTATGGMRELAFRLLLHHRHRLDFRDHTLAEKLERKEDGWRIHLRSLRDDSETTVAANGLILTPPVPQTLELLQQSNLALPDDLRDALRGVRYSRCLAVYGLFTGAGPLPDGGVWFGDGPIEWITDNRLKDVSAVGPAVTALTTDEWAETHWKETDARLLDQLLRHLQPWVGNPVFPDTVGVQRWKWARPVSPIRPPCAVVRDLAAVLAGDGFAASVPDPADAAVVSGDAAAKRMAILATLLARGDERYTVARPQRYALEVAVSTPDEASLAEWVGADRLELSSGLDVGGLTPSLGLFRAVREHVRLPVYVLLRPRPGGFAYTPREFDVMLADAKMFLDEGANGIVCAVLRSDGGIDEGRCRQLVELAEGEAVFHRAFDFLPDPLVALDTLIDIGFKRVLTSGGATTAEAGTTRLASLVQHAGWQIEVLPAGSIRPENVTDLVRETRCDQVHAALRVPVRDPLLAANTRLAAAMGATTSTSLDLVRALRQQLDRLVTLLS